MSTIAIQSRQYISRSVSNHLRQQTRCLSIVKPCLDQSNKPRQELLSDERLQQIVAELEEPLHRKAVSIGDTHNVLLESIETFRPKYDVLWVSKMEKLRTQLHNSFTVKQLGEFLAAHHLQRKGLKKQQLISTIIDKHWGIKTDEQVREEELQKKLNRIKESFPASRQELFFIIGDNGNTIRTIEQKNEVNITIDVSEGIYIVEGLPEAVGAAKKEILSHLTILEETVDLPPKVIQDQRLLHEIEAALADVSKVAGSYINLKDDKLLLSSISDESMQNAKRLISLMLVELNVTDQQKTINTVVHDGSEFTILPFYDTNAMSLYDRKLNWDKLKSNQVNEIDNYKLISNQEEEIGSFDKLNQLLLQPFNKDQLDNISMEARFGHLLFQQGQESNTSTKQVLELYKNRTLFFNAIPPRQLTTPFIPLTLDGGFHERSIQLEYINQSLLSQHNDSVPSLKRLRVEFVISEDGEMKLKNIIEEQDRSTIDILGVYGNVDIRLLAKQFKYTSDQSELIDQCKLTSYAEFNAPKIHVTNKSNLILSDITFINKKRYLYEDALISVNHIEQQDKRAKRTELTVTSVDPETLDLTSSNSRWPSFSSILTRIARKWDYSS